MQPRAVMDYLRIRKPPSSTALDPRNHPVSSQMLHLQETPFNRCHDTEGKCHTATEAPPKSWEREDYQTALYTLERESKDLRDCLSKTEKQHQVMLGYISNLTLSLVTNPAKKPKAHCAMDDSNNRHIVEELQDLLKEVNIITHDLQRQSASSPCSNYQSDKTIFEDPSRPKDEYLANLNSKHLMLSNCNIPNQVTLSTQDLDVPNPRSYNQVFWFNLEAPIINPGSNLGRGCVVNNDLDNSILTRIKSQDDSNRQCRQNEPSNTSLASLGQELRHPKDPSFLNIMKHNIRCHHCMTLGTFGTYISLNNQPNSMYNGSFRSYQLALLFRKLPSNVYI